MNDPPSSSAERPDGPPDEPVPAHPNVPTRAAVALAFAGVLVAGLLGALIGWGLVDTACDGDCGLALAVGTIAGAALASAGAAIVAVLVLRAMSEWRAHPPGS